MTDPKLREYVSSQAAAGKTAEEIAAALRLIGVGEEEIRRLLGQSRAPAVDPKIKEYVKTQLSNGKPNNAIREELKVLGLSEEEVEKYLPQYRSPAPVQKPAARRMQKPTTQSASKQGSQHVDLDKLKQFIEKNRLKGIPDSDIVKALRQNGVPQADIDRASASLGHASAGLPQSIDSYRPGPNPLIYVVAVVLIFGAFLYLVPMGSKGAADPYGGLQDTQLATQHQISYISTTTTSMTVPLDPDIVVRDYFLRYNGTKHPFKLLLRTSKYRDFRDVREHMYTFKFKKGEKPSDEQVASMEASTYLGAKEDDYLIDAVVDEIKKLNLGDSDEEAAVAIRFVQDIDYGIKKDPKTTYHNRYPYEVLYEMEGKCDEKSRLLYKILKKMGYGVALIEMHEVEHQAVGLKCPPDDDYLDTGYCFIESTSYWGWHRKSNQEQRGIKYDIRATILESPGKTFLKKKQMMERSEAEMSAVRQSTPVRAFKGFGEWLSGIIS